MQRYAPTLLDLARRDVVCRALFREMEEGLGIEGKKYLHLDLTHLGHEAIETRLPDITDFVRTYLGIDLVNALVPVQPTAHYAMGGIPTDLDARVVMDEKNAPLLANVPALMRPWRCGSDAMRINGQNALACKVLLKDLGTKITIEPLPALRVIKDLLVDLDRFLELYRNVKPYLITHTEQPEHERMQLPSDRQRFDDTTKSILCAACASSCSSYWANPDDVGSAAIVNSHRFIFDSCDEGRDERLHLLGSRDGVWFYRTIFNCVEACPRRIQVTRAITEVKNAILTRKV